MTQFKLESTLIIISLNCCVLLNLTKDRTIRFARPSLVQLVLVGIQFLVFWSHRSKYIFSRYMHCPEFLDLCSFSGRQSSPETQRKSLVPAFRSKCPAGMFRSNLPLIRKLQRPYQHGKSARHPLRRDNSLGMPHKSYHKRPNCHSCRQYQPSQTIYLEFFFRFFKKLFE